MQGHTAHVATHLNTTLPRVPSSRYISVRLSTLLPLRATASSSALGKAGGAHVRHHSHERHSRSVLQYTGNHLPDKQLWHMDNTRDDRGLHQE